MDRADSTCDEFVSAQYPGTLRSAYLLTGSRVAAEDLAQDVMVRVVDQWAKVARADDPRAYVRRILMNVYLAGRARLWRGEVPFERVPERPAPVDDASFEAHDELRRALMSLPPRQRAAVVLRHYQRLSEAETADLLGCSVGNVKSLTSRGLASLRSVMVSTPRMEAQ